MSRGDASRRVGSGLLRAADGIQGRSRPFAPVDEQFPFPISTVAFPGSRQSDLGCLSASVVQPAHEERPEGQASAPSLPLLYGAMRERMPLIRQGRKRARGMELRRLSS